MYSYLFPTFLKLDLIIWAVLIIIFVLFTRYISKLPAEAILKSNAKAIENKKRLGIKIYLFN
jgi:uncharacterized membrane protein YukC